MSVLGTNLVSSVAQTSLQAQQVARAKDRQEGKPASELSRVREMFESHLRNFEETDQDQAPTHLQIEGQLPEHQSTEQQSKRKHSQSPSEISDQSESSESPISPALNTSLPPANGTDAPLYRHVDIQI